jgi:RNA polymerase sigma-70 factor (ECF subfamily)
MGQRLVRAKRKIREAGIPLRVPERADMPVRLDAVLAAIYAAFTAGWSGDRDLVDEAIWLARLIVALMPDAAEALGLIALMLHAQARHAARRDAKGAYVPIGDQDTALWDAPMIEEAEALLCHAGTLGEIGRYQLEAAVQSVHAARRSSGTTDWAAIERLYSALATLTDSPVVTINRAIAVAQTQGAAEGLVCLDALAGDGRMAEYQPYWAARAELLSRVHDIAAADRAYARAIGLETDPAARDFLQRRQQDNRQSHQPLAGDR